jgi:hypothetical protein
MSEGGLWGAALGVFVGSLLHCSIRAGEWRVFFRSFLPNWRFFENVGRLPVLQVKETGGVGSPDWIPVPRFHERRGWDLLFNPDGNAQHAFETRMRGFLLDPEDQDLLVELTSDSVTRFRRIHPLCQALEFRFQSLDPVTGETETVKEWSWNSLSS